MWNFWHFYLHITGLLFVCVCMCVYESVCKCNVIVLWWVGKPIFRVCQNPGDVALFLNLLALHWAYHGPVFPKVWIAAKIKMWPNAGISVDKLMRSMSLKFLLSLTDLVREITTPAPNCYQRRRLGLQRHLRRLWKRGDNSRQRKKNFI